MKTYFRLFFSFFILAVISISTFTQDTNIIKFFPLKVGNVWVYSGYASLFSQCNRTFYHRLQIDSIKIINNKTYYKFNFSVKHISGTGGCGISYLYSDYYRIDSMSGNVFRQRLDSFCTYSYNEQIVDSLKSRINDTAKICSGGSNFLKILRDTFSTPVFSIQKQTKNFEGGNFFEYGFTGRYAKDFGIIEYRDFGMSTTTYAWLKGCIINGVMFGDTNFYLVGLTHISSEVPVNFSLSQNYPNPFNPTTQINFDIPRSSFVKLIVYDAIGREIEQLVNEELITGTYSIAWDASSYPSGVYFYKIAAVDYTETRKMVLIK